MTTATPMTAFRFGYHLPGQNPNGNTVCLGMTAFNTAEGAAALVARWNRRDRGIREWVCLGEALPTDIDYPGNEERRLKRLARQRKAKQRAAQQAWAAMVKCGLA